MFPVRIDRQVIVTVPVLKPAIPKAPAAPAPRPVPVPAPKVAGPGAAPSAGRAEPPAAPAVPDTVRRTFRRPRHTLLVVSFLVAVILPIAGAAVYLWGYAADQYASKLGFSVRQEETNSALELLSGLSSISGSSSSDTDILFEYLRSQRLVAELDTELGLRAIWSRPETDPYFTLDPEASIETLVEYWQDMVRLSYGAGNGLLEIEVRAFDPADATAIAEAVFRKSSEKLNELSSIAREDTIRYSRDELDTALTRLREAREKLTRFRNQNQIVDPRLDLQGQAGLLSSLQISQAEALTDLDLLSGRLRDSDPRVEEARRRVEVIEARIAAERRKLGIVGVAGKDTAFADVIGEYEQLAVEREFAEKTYLSALANYDGALAEARRQNRYLAAYMLPTRAETASYPERGVLLTMFGLFVFLVWSVVALVAYSIKDRR